MGAWLGEWVGESRASRGRCVCSPACCLSPRRRGEGGRDGRRRTSELGPGAQLGAPVEGDPGCAEEEQLPGVEKLIVNKRRTLYVSGAGLQKRSRVKLQWSFSTIRGQASVRGRSLTPRGALRCCRNRRHHQGFVFKFPLPK